MEFEEKVEIEKRFKKIENAMVAMERVLISKSKEYDELFEIQGSRISEIERKYKAHLNTEDAHDI